MLELLRNFLSGKKLIVIVILLAIPFVFFGSTSFEQLLLAMELLMGGCNTNRR